MPVSFDPEDGDALRAQLAGAIVAGGLGLAGPVAAAAGGVIGVVTERVVSQALGVFRRRERERIERTARQILEDAEHREQAGETPRGDSFFEAQADGRVEADELLEGLLRQAAAEHEARKLPYLAHLYDGVAHDESVSADDAQFLLKAADELTYRQYVALAIFSRRAEADRGQLWRSVMAADRHCAEGRSVAHPALRTELVALSNAGLIVFPSAPTTGQLHPPTGRSVSAREAPVSSGQLTEEGAALVRLMRLPDIPEAEQTAWIAMLDQPVSE